MGTVLSDLDTGGSAYTKPPRGVSWEGRKWGRAAVGSSRTETIKSLVRVVNRLVP